jgi:hypothetical protein
MILRGRVCLDLGCRAKVFKRVVYASTPGRGRVSPRQIARMDRGQARTVNDRPELYMNGSFAQSRLPA